MKSVIIATDQLFNDDKLTAYDKIILICIYLCTFSIILSIVLAQLFALVLIVLAVIHFVRNPKRENTPFDLPLLVFVLFRIFSVVFSTNLSTSARTLLTEIPYYAIFYAVSQWRTILKVRFIHSVLWMFIGAAIIGSCYGTIAALLGVTERAASLTSGYYTFGSYLATTLTMTLMLGRSRMFERKRWVWYGLIIIMAIGLLLTLNRIHWGIMIIAFIVVGLTQERKLLGIMIIFFFIALLLSPSISRRLTQTIHFTENLSDRDVLWQGASMIWFNHPVLGYGPGTFSEIFPLQGALKDKKVGGWHNDYLQVFVESGMLGLISMLWLLATIYKQLVIYLCMHKKDEHKKKLVLSMIAGITVILISSLTGSAFLDVLIRMMFGFLLALLAILLQNKENDALTTVEKNSIIKS